MALLSYLHALPFLCTAPTARPPCGGVSADFKFQHTPPAKSRPDLELAPDHGGPMPRVPDPTPRVPDLGSWIGVLVSGPESRFPCHGPRITPILPPPKSGHQLEITLRDSNSNHFLWKSLNSGNKKKFLPSRQTNHFLKKIGIWPREC